MKKKLTIIIFTLSIFVTNIFASSNYLIVKTDVIKKYLFNELFIKQKYCIFSKQYFYYLVTYLFIPDNIILDKIKTRKIEIYYENKLLKKIAAKILHYYDYKNYNINIIDKIDTKPADNEIVQLKIGKKSIHELSNKIPEGDFLQKIDVIYGNLSYANKNIFGELNISFVREFNEYEEEDIEFALLVLKRKLKYIFNIDKSELIKHNREWSLKWEKMGT